MHVLVTGGAGFIGSHTVDLLVERGYEVTVVDNLEPEVHGGRLPPWLNPKARYIFRDIRDYETLCKLLRSVDAVMHLAALVGVGQSMYQPRRYIDVNVGGTGTLLQALIDCGDRVDTIVLASSMSVYGEGRYKCPCCGRIVEPGLRSIEQAKRREWEHRCPHCGCKLEPIPTPEDKRPDPQSIYAWTKLAQEQVLRLAARAYGFRLAALRYFNVYGPRQSLRNPYTGVIAIFTARLLNGKPPVIFEDGMQIRDFIHVRDVARANVAALERRADGVFNIGTGRPTRVIDVARMLAKILGVEVEPLVLNRFRVGDVRHIYADITRAREVLGWEPRVSLEEGLREVVEWARANRWEAEDRVEQAIRELEEKGLLV